MGKRIKVKNLDLPLEFAAAKTAQEFAELRMEHNRRIFQEKNIDPDKGAMFMEDAAREAYGQLRRDAMSRRDSATVNAGIFGSRDLEHNDPVPIRELFPKLTGLNIFKANARGIKFGAKTWRRKRIQEFGEPIVFGSQGKDVPKVKLRSSEETGIVLNYVLGIEYSLFDEAAAGFANVSLVADNWAAAERRMAKFVSDKSLDGSEEDKLVGVLNHEWFTRLSFATTFKVGGDGPAMLETLEKIVTATVEKIAGHEQLAPNNLWVSPRLYVTLSRTTVYPSGDTKTVLEKFKERNPGIKINQGQDLTGRGFEGRDVILAVNDSIESGSNQVINEFTALPLETHSFMREQDGYFTHAGLRSDYPVGNVIAEVNFSR